MIEINSGLSLMRTPTRGPYSVRYKGSWLYIHWIDFAPPRKPCRIGLLFTDKNDCGGAISVTERGCTAQKSGAKVERHIGDTFLAILWCSWNNYSAHRRSKWVEARTATHWHGSKYLGVRAGTMFRCVWTTWWIANFSWNNEKLWGIMST